MQFGVELALLRTPPPLLGGREEQVASCRDEKRDDALTGPLRLMQYICCGNKNLAIYKYASNPSAKIRNCYSSEDQHASKKIAEVIGVHPSTICREVKRNLTPAGNYSPTQAHMFAKERQDWKNKASAIVS